MDPIPIYPARTVEDAEPHCRIEVDDDGAGIPEERAEEVFGFGKFRDAHAHRSPLRARRAASPALKPRPPHAMLEPALRRRVV